MAVPSLALPSSPWTRAFRAIVRILETDPALRAAGVTILSWQGTPGEADASPRPPEIRLTPASGGAQWITEGQHEIPLGITVDLAVRGTCVDDLMNLWWAVMNALYPAAGSAREATVEQLTARENASNLIQQLSITGAPLTPTPGTDPVPHLTGTGELTLLIWVSTGE